MWRTTLRGTLIWVGKDAALVYEPASASSLQVNATASLRNDSSPPAFRSNRELPTTAALLTTAGCLQRRFRLRPRSAQEVGLEHALPWHLDQAAALEYEPVLQSFVKRIRHIDLIGDAIGLHT